MRALSLALVCAAAPAAADPMPMSAGASPAPSTSDSIAIAREDLAIEVAGDTAAVRALLTLENHGSAARLDVGFPCDAGAEPGMAGLDCKTPIRVTIDGARRAARRVKSSFVWPMRFAAGQSRVVEVSYKTRLRNERYDKPYFGMGTLYYRLTTGARWAGPIGVLDMRVDMPTDALVHIAPAGYQRDHGRTTWHLTDVEPTEDLAILVHPIYLGRYAGAVKAASRAELIDALGAGRADRAALERVAGQMRSGMDEILRYAAFFHSAARAKLGLPEPRPDEVRACVEASAALMLRTP